MTDKDKAFAAWYYGEFGYELDTNGEFGHDAAFRSAFEAGAKFERDRARRLLTEAMIVAAVQNIPVPWKYGRNGHSTVIATEFPPNRPQEIDLVFDDGVMMSEKLGTQYEFNPKTKAWRLR